MSGWARDPDTADPIQVRIYRDGAANPTTLLATVTAGNPRPDLPFGDKNHGFSYQITSPYLFDNLDHSVYIYGADATGDPDALLSNNPRNIRCGPISALAARVDIAGAPNPIVAGRIASLTAVVRDAAGKPLSGIPINWTSSNSNIVQIDGNGVLKGVGLGTVTITASAGSRQGRMNLTVVPLRVEINPPSVSLATGDRQRFTARAVDTAGQPLSGATIAWQVLFSNGQTTNAMSVDAGGMLTASIEGRYTVQASATGPGGSIPVRGFASLQIDLKPPFRFAPVFSNDLIPGPQKFLSPAANIVFGDGGQFAFPANLNGWAQETFLWDNGEFVPLVAPGETDFGLARMRSNHVVGGMNSRQVLLYGGDGLVLANRNEVENLLPQNVWLGWATNFGGFSTGPHGMNEAGEVAFYASRFQYAGSSTVLSGIFKMRGSQVTPIWTSDQPLERFPNGYGFTTPVNIDRRGNIYFRVAAPGSTSTAVYVTDGASPPRLVVGTGADGVPNGTVSSYTGPFINEAGDIVYSAALNNGRFRLFRVRQGAQEDVDLGTVQQFPYAIDATGRAVLRRQGSQQGLYVWDSGDPRLVLGLAAPAPDGGTITNFDTAGFDAAGNVIAQVRTSRGGIAIMRASGEALLQSGDMLSLDVPPLLSTQSLVQGATPRLQLASSLFEMRPTGLEPLINLGDQLDQGLTFSAAASNRFVDAGPQGVYFVHSNTFLYRRTDSGYQRVVTAPSAIPAFGVNRAGHATVVFGGGVSYFDGSTLTRVADNATAAPTGGVFTNWTQVSIDDRDRILGLATTSEGISGVFLYDGTWQTKLVLNRTQIRGTVITSINGFIRAAGGKFYASLQGVGFGALASLQDGDWAVELGYGDPLPFSTELVQNVNAFDVNVNGDLLVRISGQGRTYLVVKSAGVLKPVLHNGVPIEGSYIPNVSNVLLQDDGVAYFAGFDQFWRYRIIRADPL